MLTCPQVVAGLAESRDLAPTKRGSASSIATLGATDGERSSDSIRPGGDT